MDVKLTGWLPSLLARCMVRWLDSSMIVFFCMTVRLTAILLVELYPALLTLEKLVGFSNTLKTDGLIDWLLILLEHRLVRCHTTASWLASKLTC